MNVNQQEQNLITFTPPTGQQVMQMQYAAGKQTEKPKEENKIRIGLDFEPETV